MASPHKGIELTARGRVTAALAAASLLGAWLSGDGNVRLAAALLTAPLVVDLAQKARTLGAVTVQVAPRRTVAIAAFRETLQVHNGGRAVLRDLLLREQATHGPATLVVELPPGGRTTAVLACHGPPRSHQLERVFTLATDWPLGLFRATATAVVATDFVAEPRRVALRLCAEPTADPQRAPHPRSHLVGDEFHALREHRPDEEARGVHALRSAAHGQLVRTVVRGRLPQRVGIVVDLRRPPGRVLHHGRNRFEWSLGACASLLDELAATGTTALVLVLGSRTVRWDVDGEAPRRGLLTLLAEVAASPHRALEPGELDELHGLTPCYWIPAGGYRVHGELPDLPVRVLDGDSA